MSLEEEIRKTIQVCARDDVDCEVNKHVRVQVLEHLSDSSLL